jgi:hypothetical protein
VDNRIALLKSETVGAIPTASAMLAGQVAVNYADKKIYGKHPGSGAVVQVAAAPTHTHSISDVDGLQAALDAGGGAGVESVNGEMGEVVLTASDVGAIAKNSTDTTPVNVIRVITQAEYNAISPKDANTLYFIKD